MKYLTSTLYQRFEHPLLVSLYALAGVFIVVGLGLDLIGSNRIAAAFFGVYAVVLIGIGSLWYATLYAVRYVSERRDESAAYLS